MPSPPLVTNIPAQAPNGVTRLFVTGEVSFVAIPRRHSQARYTEKKATKGRCAHGIHLESVHAAASSAARPGADTPPGLERGGFLHGAGDSVGPGGTGSQVGP